MKSFFKEFKIFISRGSVMDLAIAFIMGAAFKAIVSSFVNHIIMPVVSLVFGSQGFENYKYVITEADEAGGIAENAIYYGLFIQNIIDFILVAFVIFLMVKGMNHVKDALSKKEEVLVEEMKEKKPTVEELLTDIKTIISKE